MPVSRMLDTTPPKRSPLATRIDGVIGDTMRPAQLHGASRGAWNARSSGMDSVASVPGRGKVGTTIQGPGARGAGARVPGRGRAGTNGASRRHLARNRRRLAAGAATLAAGLSLATAAPVGAAADGYCSPSGDYCTSVRKHKGVRELTISTFSFRGKVDICVTAPGGGYPACRTRALKAGKGSAGDLYTASIRWSTNYPRAPKGKRTVVFQSDNTQLGPDLAFSVG